jgi:hypothetical protein
VTMISSINPSSVVAPVCAIVAGGNDAARIPSRASDRIPGRRELMSSCAISGIPLKPKHYATFLFSSVLSSIGHTTHLDGGAEIDPTCADFATITGAAIPLRSVPT